MLEIELKILEINKKEVISRIKKLKPKPQKLFEGLVRVKYFDFPDKRIYRKKNLLRLRQFIPKRKKSYIELVYKICKGVKNGCKYFDEIEFTLPNGNFQKLSKFFKQLCLKQALYYEKKRTLYRYGKTKFEIDEHPRIPVFLEIEGPSPSAIKKAITWLGLGNNEQSSETIEELLKRKYPRVKLNKLTF